MEGKVIQLSKAECRWSDHVYYMTQETFLSGVATPFNSLPLNAGLLYLLHV